MERSRDGKRAVSAPRRLRISCPKDPADAEARMDETPLIEKFKKGNLQGFPVSYTAQVGTTATAWSKKKRQVLQEAHFLLERTNVGNDSAERAEIAPSEEEDEEAPVLHSFTSFGRSRSKERAKEDEIVMDISNIPRRARSSGTRFSSLRRQLEPCSTGISSQQAPTAYQQRSPSPNILAKRSAGKKNRPLKDFRLMGSPQISDQEVEVAEVLFDLSRSIPSLFQLSKRMRQEKSVRGLEDGDFDSSSSQAVGSPPSEHQQNSSSDEPKSKRQRTTSNLKQEETSVMMAAGVGPVGVDELQNKQKNGSENFREKTYSEAMMDFCYGDSQLLFVDDKNAEQRSKELAKAKAEHIIIQEDLASPSTSKVGLCVQVSCKDGEHFKLSSRSCEGEQANGSRSKLHMVCPSTNLITEDEGEDAIETGNKRLSLSENTSIILRNGGEKIYSTTTEKVSEGNNVLGPSAVNVENESNTGRILANGGNQEHLKYTSGPWKEEQADFKLLDVKKQNENVFDEGPRPACLPLCTLPLTSKNNVTPTGFPPLGFYGKAAPPWLANAFFLGSSLDRKTHYPAIQLPHTTTQHSFLRMRRCATHVYIAHYIQQRQQFLRQTFWPPACHSGAAYNPSTLPAYRQGEEQWSDNDAYLPSLQAGSVTLTESIGTRKPSSRGSMTALKSENAVPSNSIHGLSAGAGTGANLSHAMSWGTHGQYAAATTLRNGFASLYTPSNKPSGQSSSIFDKSFHYAHSSPSELQSPAQQTSNPSRRQVPPSSPHVGLSHPLSTQPYPQLKQQAQQERQQHYTTIMSQCYVAGTDGYSGGDRGGPMLNGKQSVNVHQQAHLQVQQAASASDTQISHQLSFEPKVKDMNSVPKESDLLGISCKDRATVGPVQSDLATSTMAAKAKSHGGHDQRQETLGTQQQQCYQRSYLRAPAISSKKDQSMLAEGQSPIRQAGGSTNGSKTMESYLPVNVVTSTCGVPAPIDQLTCSSETVFSSNGKLASLHHIQKQAMAVVKPFSGANTAGVAVENASVWGNIRKIPPSPGHTVSSSQNVVKASHTSGISNGPLLSFTSPGQQVWSSLTSAPNWVPQNKCEPRSSSGNFSLCAIPPSSSLKVAGSSTLNNTFIGEGSSPVSRKTATVGDPNSPSILNSGEKPSRVEAQPQGHGEGQTKSPQQQSINLQPTRHQAYQQPHPSSNKHQQSVHQHQSLPSQVQQLSPQSQIQSSTLQQSHLHKQLHSLPLNATLSSGLSQSVTLRATSQGETNSGTSTGQANNEK